MNSFNKIFNLKILNYLSIILICTFSCTILCQTETDTVRIGFNYPKTGPYSSQGLDQLRALDLAVEEINNSGGILGKNIEIIKRDTMSDPKVAVSNALELIEKYNVKMILGGVSSGVAVAVSEIAQAKKTLFMATISASNATTVEKAHRHTFRVSFNAWMGAKALSNYLTKKYAGKKYFYIVSDYTWGLSSEKSLRKFTNTEDKILHKVIYTPFPNASEEDFQKAIALAKIVKPDVLVLVLFGQDMSSAIRLATMMGLKNDMRIVVPLLELALSDEAGPKVMEGVVGAADWNWKIPYEYGYINGQQFVEKFSDKYKRYPCWGASTTYTNIYEYKEAVERAKTFDTNKVIKSLENHKFSLLKDEQEWRGFDHQNVQSVYVVQCKDQEDVLKDKFKLDYYKILERYLGETVVQSKDEWEEIRKEANLPIKLEDLE